eukprot:3078448-Rhodomonas_salina.2
MQGHGKSRGAVVVHVSSTVRCPLKSPVLSQKISATEHDVRRALSQCAVPNPAHAAFGAIHAWAFAL